jgi:hypothetical protein
MNAPADEALSFREAEVTSLDDGDETLFPAELTFEQFIQMVRFFDVMWLSFDVFICSSRPQQLSEEWEKVYAFPTLCRRYSKVQIHLFVYSSTQARGNQNHAPLRFPFFLLRHVIKDLTGDYVPSGWLEWFTPVSSA